MTAVAVLALAAACGQDPASAPLSFPKTPATTSTTAPPPTPGGGGALAPGADGLGDPYFPKAGNGGYDVGNYGLDVTYDPATDRLTGVATIQATATSGLSRFNLDLHGLTVQSVKVGDAAAQFTRQGDELTITPARGLEQGTAFTVEIRYAGVPSGYTDPQLGSLGFLATSDGAIAQGEPEVAASWYPVNDHPRDKATYDIALTVPDGLAALSNGTLKSRTRVAGGKTKWVWRETSPMASYLATVLIGRYRVSETKHGNLPVVTAVHTSLPTSIDTVMKRTPEVLDFLVTQFGPYPFEALGGVVHNDPRFGFALENQSRPVYSPSFFSSTESAVAVQVHELAHQWFGNSVSVDTWREIWLNEGFATYAEWLWSGKSGRQSPQQLFDSHYQSRTWRVKIGDPGKDDLFAGAVYDQGAMTLHALRVTIGDQKFFQLVKDWAAKKQDGNATTAEFIALAEQVSGKNLKSFFDPWLYKAAKPPYPRP
jgi:aminopeptidase N